MLGSLLTALFFGLTPVCANRAIRLAGFVRANLGRLLVALCVLGAWALLFGQGFEGRFPEFFAAGAVGFGLGGLCMFRALPRLGSPLSLLMVESIAAVAAAALAWSWFGDAIPPAHMVWGALVLAGVAVGLSPYISGADRLPSAGVGAWWALLAGLGQAVSITISRKALLSMKMAGLPVDLPTAAFQRLLGGAAVAASVWLAFLLIRRLPEFGKGQGAWDRAWMWVGLNALFGPILGVSCLIWALQTMQPGLAQTVAATAPLVSVPFSRWLEGRTPPPLYYAGCLAVLAGLAGIHLSG